MHRNASEMTAVGSSSRRMHIWDVGCQTLRTKCCKMSWSSRYEREPSVVWVGWGRRGGASLKTCPLAYFILMAFITGNSSLEPLLEDLLAQIHIDLS